MLEKLRSRDEQLNNLQKLGWRQHLYRRVYKPCLVPGDNDIRTPRQCDGNLKRILKIGMIRTKVRFDIGRVNRQKPNQRRDFFNKQLGFSSACRLPNDVNRIARRQSAESTLIAVTYAYIDDGLCIVGKGSSVCQIVDY